MVDLGHLNVRIASFLCLSFSKVPKWRILCLVHGLSFSFASLVLCVFLASLISASHAVSNTMAAEKFEVDLGDTEWLRVVGVMDWAMFVFGRLGHVG
jgi:hypothetical protein